MTGSRRPRLILLSQWYDPEGCLKGSAFARRLVDLGFDVEVVTGFPNYPGGKVYPGYRIRPMQRETLDGVPVTRLALYPSHDRSKIGRILNYVSFFLSSAIYLVAFARRADVIYAYHPPLTVGVAAALARLLRRTPVLLDVQDMWPDTLRATGMIGNERVLRFIGVLCRWTWRGADHVVAQSDGFRDLLTARGVLPENVSVIHNWSPEEHAQPSATERANLLGGAGRFRLLFAGNIGPAQGLDCVLDAAKLLVDPSPEIEFCFMGKGLEVDRLKARAAKERLSNVRFLPHVPLADVQNWLRGADALLVHLKDDPLFALTIPSKTQAYLAVGKPIVMAVSGDAADLVERSGGGIIVPPENPRALADAVVTLANLPPTECARMGAAGRRFYETEMSFDAGGQAFAERLHALARGEHRRTVRRS